MLIFKDVGKPTSYAEAQADGNIPEGEAPLIQQLEGELRVTKEHLRSTVEEIETSNEELKSANEELLSMNEELQSSNEELQTSKEEMQSINEELETVNAELRNKVEELDAANSDIQNLFESTRIATVFLDESLCIKRFTPTATELFRLIGTDVGRPITDISLELEDVDIVADVQSVLRSLAPIEQEVQVKNGSTYYKMRIMPYRTLENAISGTVLTFVDITSLRQARNRAEQWAQRQSAIAEVGTYALQDNAAAAVCDHAIDLVCQTLESDICGLFVHQPEDAANLLLQSGSGWPSGYPGRATLSATDSHPGYTLTAQQPVIVSDLIQEQRFAPTSLLQDLHLTSGISAIIYDAESVYGVLTSYTTRSRQFTPEDTDFLQAIANVLAAALQRETTMQVLAKNRERLDLAIHAGNMGIWELDIATGQAAWNAIEYSLLGLSPEEESESSAALFYRYVHPDDVQLVQTEIETAIEQKTEFSTEFRITRTGHVERWLAAKARVVTNAEGAAVKVIGVNYDITERKQNEEALKAADRRKDDFLAVLGHELRNPLNALSSSISLMQTLGAEAALEATFRDRLQQLQTVADRQLAQLTRLVDDLLDVSRFSHQKIQLRPCPFNLTQLLSHIVADAQSNAVEKNITFETALPEVDIQVNGDAARLTQAFSNVLQNAIKFSEPGSRVSISTEATAAADATITTKITDSGIGVEPEALTRIFTAFSQENRSLARSGGLGLGLPLAKSIIELHRGQIWAESSGIGQGTTVTIKLPQLIEDGSAQPAATAPIAPSPVLPADQPKRILVIEDSEDSAMLLQMFLEGVGYQVMLANNGSQGIALAKQFQPQIIISDIGLTSAMDGYAVARSLRADPATQDAFLVATSGYGQPEDKARAIAVGFNQHLSKPVDLEQLQALLERGSSPSPLP